MKRLPFFILTLSLFLAACEDPAADKPRAEISEPASNVELERNSANANTEESKEEVQGEEIPISAENSKIEFTGSKVTGKHDGGFKEFSGMIDLVDEDPTKSKVTVDIKMSSVFTDADGLTEHLKTGDFFETEKYPRSTFVSTGIEPDKSGGENTYVISGEFELHGIKKAISFPATINVNGEKVEVKSEFSVNRKDFQINYAGKADDLIRDGVVIKLDLNAPRKK